ncbi:hypothetical protein WSK_0411 [Novosphingobium sp. Rr 2-17]|uniref:hypothetical protein n=1 Tax=Novosphingobium sp. Rr 2-17 TaxID=555793 RepID=UPI00026994C3|nr:hypothetical protein [Novosphingobium sp. Rr 2-17]EIZ81019.1 hypothetical protein WSK_0411 [Novosphingobium sp. Rr 2-17]
MADDSAETVSSKAAAPTHDTVRVRLAEAGFAVPQENLSGVLANLTVLHDHVATLRGFALDPRSASAMRFEV